MNWNNIYIIVLFPVWGPLCAIAFILGSLVSLAIGAFKAGVEHRSK